MLTLFLIANELVLGLALSGRILGQICRVFLSVFDHACLTVSYDVQNHLLLKISAAKLRRF